MRVLWNEITLDNHHSDPRESVHVLKVPIG